MVLSTCRYSHKTSVASICYNLLQIFQDCKAANTAPVAATGSHNTSLTTIATILLNATHYIPAVYCPMCSCVPVPPVVEPVLLPSIYQDTCLLATDLTTRHHTHSDHHAAGNALDTGRLHLQDGTEKVSAANCLKCLHLGLFIPACVLTASWCCIRFHSTQYAAG